LQKITSTENKKKICLNTLREGFRQIFLLIKINISLNVRLRRSSVSNIHVFVRWSPSPSKGRSQNPPWNPDRNASLEIRHPKRSSPPTTTASPNDSLRTTLSPPASIPSPDVGSQAQFSLPMKACSIGADALARRKIVQSTRSEISLKIEASIPTLYETAHKL